MWVPKKKKKKKKSKIIMRNEKQILFSEIAKRNVDGGQRIKENIYFVSIYGGQLQKLFGKKKK
jgi:hypothetical protein